MSDSLYVFFRDSRRTEFVSNGFHQAGFPASPDYSNDFYDIVVMVIASYLSKVLFAFE